VREIALALWIRGDRVFLQRRDPNASVLPGLWEFPGGKLEPGEAPEAACVREFREELHLACRPVQGLGDLAHDYEHGAVRLHAFLVEAEGRPATTLAWGWFTRAEMLRLALPEANRGLLEILPPFGAHGAPFGRP
jgi:mutator protein MutT